MGTSENVCRSDAELTDGNINVEVFQPKTNITSIRIMNCKASEALNAE